MKNRTVFAASLAGAFVLGLSCGSQLRLSSLNSGSSTHRAFELIPEKDYFFNQDTFSETESARRLIHAECQRFLTAYRIERLSLKDHGVNLDEQLRGFEEKWRPRFRERLAAYRGLPEEYLVLNFYLHFLRRANDYDQFIEYYLDALYRHPGEMVVGVQAPRALQIATLLGRSDELVHELQRVLAIPIELTSQAWIQRALSTWKNQTKDPPTVDEQRSCIRRIK